MNNPRDAIILIKADTPDLIIFEPDLKQDRSGLEAVTDLNHHIPFIVLSSNSDAQTTASVKKYCPVLYAACKSFSPKPLFPKKK